MGGACSRRAAAREENSQDSVARWRRWWTGHGGQWWYWGTEWEHPLAARYWRWEDTDPFEEFGGWWRWEEEWGDAGIWVWRRWENAGPAEGALAGEPSEGDWLIRAVPGVALGRQWMRFEKFPAPYEGGFWQFTGMLAYSRKYSWAEADISE